MNFKNNRTLSRGYKFARAASWLYFILSFLVLLYTYWQAEIVFDGSLDGLFFKFYLISIVAIIFWGIILRLKDEVKLNTVIMTCSLIFGLYAVELVLYFAEPQKNIPGADVALKLGVSFDKRSKIKVVSDLQKNGIDVVPSVYPWAFIKKLKSKDSNGSISLLPLGGVSNKTVVYCNESGEYTIYRSDRYGFNNPDREWDDKKIKWFLTGDSFAQGACVKPVDSIARKISQLTGDSSLSVGIGGNGPLIELAALKEYAEKLRPENVLWVYFEGNDLLDLNEEKEISVLTNYLDDGFSQNLRNRQSEVDLILSSYISTEKINAEQEDARKKEIDEARSGMRSTRIIRLYHLRARLNFNWYGVIPDNDLDLALFSKILLKAKNRVNSWGGNFYFIYLPDFERYSTNFNDNIAPLKKRNDIIGIVKNLNIPVIDIHKEVFKNHPNPRSLFPFSVGGHYTPLGYQLVTSSIVEGVRKSIK